MDPEVQQSMHGEVLRSYFLGSRKEQVLAIHLFMAFYSLIGKHNKPSAVADPGGQAVHLPDRSWICHCSVQSCQINAQKFCASTKQSLKWQVWNARSFSL